MLWVENWEQTLVVGVRTALRMYASRISWLGEGVELKCRRTWARRCEERRGEVWVASRPVLFVAMLDMIAGGESSRKQVGKEMSWNYYQYRLLGLGKCGGMELGNAGISGGLPCEL